MKWRRRWRIDGLVLWAFAATAVAGGQGLVAGAYPGAVRDKQAGDVTVQVYLTNAPLKQVSAWYTRKVGAMTEKGAESIGYADAANGNAGRTVGEVDAGLGKTRLGHVVMDQSTVVRSLKDMTATKDVGVVCEAMHRSAEKRATAPSQATSGVGQTSGAGNAQAQAMMQQMQQFEAKVNQASQQMMAETTPEDRKIAAMSDLFDGLRNEADAGLHGHTKQELLQVYAKYKHLETAWYPTVKTANGPESYDRWLLKRDRAELKGEVHAAAAPASAGAGDMQALSAKIQAAAAAGRMDEVRALSARMQQAMHSQHAVAAQGSKAVFKDQWSFWMKFLKDLNAHAYRTRIWVNTQPKTWGY